jgi:1-acyl-sn-glycerol-3-phosphate acyltransferase
VGADLSSYRFTWFDRFCLWYPPGWLILFNRHWQHYHADPDGWRSLEYGLFLLPGGFYLALLLRWLRLGCQPPRSRVSQPDPTYQRAFQQEVLTPIAQRHFRATLALENPLPTQTAAIAVMNHAGMCFPWDFLCLVWLLNQQGNWFIRPLAHPLFFDHPWLIWWLPPGWAEVMGGVRADPDSFEQVMAAIATAAKFELGTSDIDITLLLYAPEAWRGLIKPRNQQYCLKPFDPSFLRLSLRYRVPVLPIACLGNESLHPWTINLQPLARWLGLPLFPLSPLILAFLLFPSMGVWAMPTHLRYYPLPLWQPWQDLTVQPGQQPRRAVLYQLADRLRSRLQATLQGLRSQPCGGERKENA